MAVTTEISPFQRVLLGATGRDAARISRVFALDNECAHIARVAHEPLMAQIRLAWWRDALSATEMGAEHRAPMTEAIRALDGFGAMRPHLIAMIDGWEELVAGDEGDLAGLVRRYARGRGGGLFAALSPDSCGAASDVGTVWALWDLAGNAGNEALARQAIALAREIEASPPRRRMLAMMHGAARHDIARDRGAPPDLTPRLYFRLLRMQFFGR